jgi:malonyl-CoA O-methyltransferase
MSADAPIPDQDPREVDMHAVRRAFGRAAPTYDAAAVLQREVGERMDARLEVVRLDPAMVLDAGCGTGGAIGPLGLRYPAAGVVALDFAQPMVAAARERVRGDRTLLQRLLPFRRSQRGSPPGYVCGDINALPFGAAAFDLVWSNLALQWVNDLPRALGELRRVLRVGGLLTFTTFGPDTLREVRAAFAAVDGHTHTNRFADMHDIGDMLVHAGLADPVIDMETITLTYGDARSMLRDLKLIGATNATRGRSRGLMGKARLARVLANIEALASAGRIPATFEVIYGHAWKVEAVRTPDGLPIVRFGRR